MLMARSLLILLLLTAMPCVAQLADLRFQLPPDVPVRYVWTSESWQRTEGKDPARGTTKEGTARVVVELKRFPTTDTGTCRVLLTIKSLEMEFVTPMGRVRVDSQKPSTDEMAKSIEGAIKPIVGTPVELKCAANGDIESVTGAEALIRGSDAKAKFAGEYLSLTGVKRKFGPIFSCLGQTKPQAVGASWSRDEQFEMIPGTPSLPLTETASLTAIRGDIAAMEHRGATKVDDLPRQMGHGAIIEKSDCSLNGSREWNTKLGTLERFAEEQEVDARMLMSKDMPISVRAKLKVTLNRADSK